VFPEFSDGMLSKRFGWRAVNNDVQGSEEDVFSRRCLNTVSRDCPRPDYRNASSYDWSIKDIVTCKFTIERPRA